MNTPTVVAIAAVLLVAGSSIGLPIIQLVHAQYTGESGGVTVEEQLKLAKAKVTSAQQNPATGSGTPMLGTNIDQTLLFVGIVVAIFGGVAGVFFALSRGKPAKAAT